MKQYRVSWHETRREETPTTGLVDFLNSLYANENRDSSPFAEVICGMCKRTLSDPVNVTTIPVADDLLLYPIGYHFCPYCGEKLDEERL